MKLPPTPSGETRRLEALRGYDILDTAPELAFDDLANLAAVICETPIALISFVDENRQWFKSHIGLKEQETPRDISFCAHAINEPTELLEVRDSRENELFYDNPLVTGDTQMIFYAGFPLVDPEGNALGTLCVIDHSPKELKEKQKEALRSLARQVVSQLEFRKSIQDRNKQNLHLVEQMKAKAETEQKLNELNLLHEQTEKTANIGSWYLDLLTDKLHWSDEAYHIHELIPGHPLTLQESVKFYHKESLPTINQAIKRGIEHGEAWDLELRLVTGNKKEKWVNTIGHPIKTHGRVVAIKGFFHDITSTKNLFLQWEERSQNLIAIVENTKDLIWSVDFEYKLLACNKAFKRSIKKNIGHTLKERDLVLDPAYPKDVLRVWKSYYDRALAGESFATEISYEEDDRQIHGLLSFNGILNKDKQIVGCNVFLRDITALKQKEEKLLQSEAKFRSIFENCHDIIGLINPEGSIQSLNRALGGFDLEEVIGTTLFDWVLDESELLNCKQSIKTTFDQGIPTRYDASIRNKEGHMTYHSVVISPVLINEKAMRGIIISRDVTQDRHAQVKLKESTLALRKSHEKLQELNEGLELKVKERTEKLQVQAEELRQFAHIASHDLQEPLRGITNYLQLLDEDYSKKLDAVARRYIERSVKATRRMKNLISDLLSYSRITTKDNTFKKISLNKVLQSVLETLEVTIKENAAEIIHEPLPDVQADFQQIHQLLQNLISNSIKYRSPDKLPIVRVKAKRAKDHYIVSVTDNGIGISEKYKEQIFSIFQRLHTREEYPGTGIGLAICKRVVEEHKGKIWVESVPNAGSTFFFTLPLN